MSPARSSAAESQAVRNLLVSTSTEQLLGSIGTQRDLCLLRSTATVAQALIELSKRRILSAPVVAVSGAEVSSHQATCPGSSPQSDTLGFLDIRDILCSFMHELKDAGLDNKKMLQRISVLEERGTQFGETQLRALHTIGYDGGLMHMSQKRACLLELIMYGLLKPKERGMHEGTTQRHVVHRIGFFDNTGSVCALISQTDIVRYLAQHLQQLGPIAAQSIQELGLVRRDVQGVTPETPAIEALAHMQEQQLSSLAVLDRSGRLIGNFSISDLRCITPARFGALALPVGEFLALGNRMEYIGYNRESVAGTAGHKFASEPVGRAHPRVMGEDVGQALVLGRPTDTFGAVLAKIAGHGIHRVYVIDDEERPVGIVTCTDILRTLVETAVTCREVTSEQAAEVAVAAGASEGVAAQASA